MRALTLGPCGGFLLLALYWADGTWTWQPGSVSAGSPV